MNVIVKGVHLRVSPALHQYVWQHLVQPLAQFYSDSAAQLEVRLVDNNGPKGGLDKECRVWARLPGRPSVQVTEVSDDLYKAVALCRERVERVTKRELARRRPARLRRQGAKFRSWDLAQTL